MHGRMVDLEVHIHVERRNAVKVSLDGDERRAVWLPLVAIEFAPRRGGRLADITLTEHLATDKGLV